MTQIIKNFNGETPMGWRKVRNACIIAGLILAWFLAASGDAGIIIPKWLDQSLQMLNGFSALLATIAQGQSAGSDNLNR